jgi:hypothetical protein
MPYLSDWYQGDTDEELKSLPLIWDVFYDEGNDPFEPQTSISVSHVI